ncbi:DUF4406 domain-containing protein [Burkholderia multivorans]|uniref:DUF4406 domain-containing protein n=1 Tax=Burkholderia multivorans TaxID=87883 RepID=UPI001C21364F|nr:DUF4406 domain-containing protein [Burkholderia multivorans]MBU9468321.1 DUF4406 domain-containing protein [Burkholderia multivorans]MCA8129400.1 DUF4406 domain-containing protein [Burkholderia multivorans]
MRIYVAGPMTGHPHLNFPAFHAEAARLRSLGYDVVNPAELNTDPDADWLQCMRTDIKHLVDCDAIALLEGWHTSRGAQLEYTIATMLGHAVFRAVDIVERIAA